MASKPPNAGGCFTLALYNRSSTHPQGIQSRLLDTKAVGEVQAMGDFFAMLSNQPDRAQYGFNHVKVCVSCAFV